MHVGVGVNLCVWARPGWPGYMTDSWPEKVSQSGPGLHCEVQTNTEITWGQVGPGQLELGQVGPGQVELGQLGPHLQAGDS